MNRTDRRRHDEFFRSASAASARRARAPLRASVSDPNRERSPKGNEWRQTHRGMIPFDGVVSASRWVSGPLLVCSSLERAELPDGAGVGLQWHVSISAMGKRAKPKEVRRALRAFGMEWSEQDNHEPGNAKNFWLPVDPAHRVDCQCKIDEVTIVEPDGHTWTNDRDPAKCHGCELWRIFPDRRCPIHGAEANP